MAGSGQGVDDPVALAEALLASGVLKKIGPIDLPNRKICRNPHYTVGLLVDILLNGRRKNKAMRSLVALLKLLEPHVDVHRDNPAIEDMRRWHANDQFERIGAPIHMTRGELINQELGPIVGLWLEEAHLVSWVGRAARHRLRKLHIQVASMIQEG